MRFYYRHEKDLSGGVKVSANIRWDIEGKWPLKRGSFPVDHPATRFAEELDAFKARGYWVGIFPEGDGLTLDLQRNQTEEQVLQDIRECFGWEQVDDPDMALSAWANAAMQANPSE